MYNAWMELNGCSNSATFSMQKLSMRQAEVKCSTELSRLAHRHMSELKFTDRYSQSTRLHYRSRLSPRTVHCRGFLSFRFLLLSVQASSSWPPSRKLSCVRAEQLSSDPLRSTQPSMRWATRVQHSSCLPRETTLQPSPETSLMSTSVSHG